MLATGSRFDSDKALHSKSNVGPRVADRVEQVEAKASEVLAIVRPSRRWDTVHTSLRLRLPGLETKKAES